ncbi:MAG TPA: glutamine synthetase [Acidimicrobiaceae bacterium]|jgi:glutamine synthetase|nr:glutamine synthetase [Acidimicrobiaceae bacterium]
MEHQQSYVLRTVEERRVRLVRLWFCDVLGQMKSIAISPVELETAFEEGVQFDGSAIDGFSRVQESDVLAVPDASSFQLMNWGEGGEVTGAMFCDLINLDGTPFEGDPRQVLKRNLNKARAAGFTLMCAPEVEFFYFAADSLDGPPRPLDSASYFDLTTFDASSDIRRETIQRLEATGIPVEYSFHEDAPSQHEIDLRYSDALSMADNLMSLRLIVREVALQHGVHATFMPKPLAGVQGSGMHTHMSLFAKETNSFFDEDAEAHLSETARQFIAGLLRHAPEITACTNQLVNSYKRLVSGFEAPIHLTWARNNRSALIRVPVTKRGKEPVATRIEYRAIDPACNPYLAFSAMLAAGLAGVEGKYELQPETSANLAEATDTELLQGGIGLLPASLAEALDAMESSELMKETLGEHIFEWFLRNKRAEWADYKAHVSQFEIERYIRNW